MNHYSRARRNAFVVAEVRSSLLLLECRFSAMTNDSGAWLPDQIHQTQRGSLLARQAPHVQGGYRPGQRSLTPTHHRSTYRHQPVTLAHREPALRSLYRPRKLFVNFFI